MKIKEGVERNYRFGKKN